MLLETAENKALSNGTNQSLIFTIFSSFTGLKPNTSGHPNPTKYSANDLTNYTKGHSSVIVDSC